MRKLLVIGGLAALTAAAVAVAAPERSQQSRKTVPIFVRRIYVKVRAPSARVVCPPGWAVASGALDRSFASTGGATGSWPDGQRTWVFRAEGEARFRGFVTCIRSNPPVAISWGSAKIAVDSSSGGGVEPILCPAGQKPTGWGFDFRLERGPARPLGAVTPPPRMEVSFTTALPQVDGWDIGLVHSAARGEVRVRCMRPRTRGRARYLIKTRRIGRTVRLEPLARRQVTQRCPRGWSPLSPGWSSPGADESEIRATVLSFITRSGEATYFAANVTRDALEVGFHLLCVRDVAQAVG